MVVAIACVGRVSILAGVRMFFLKIQSGGEISGRKNREDPSLTELT